MADYIKITPEVCEALQRPHRTILNMIRDGKLKGKMFSARDWRVDTCELPSSFLAGLNIQKPPETPPEISDGISQNDIPPSSRIVTSQVTYKPIESSNTKPLSETAKALQDVQDNIKLLDLRVKETESQIKLDEALKRRDLPQTLISRDKASQERENLVKQREDSVAQREVSVAQREMNIKQAEIEIVAKAQQADNYVNDKTAEANKIMSEADKYDKSKRKEADDYYAGKLELSKALDAEIADKQTDLDQLNNDIPHRANELINSIKTWTNYAGQHASQAQFKEQYHKASSLWNLKESLQKILHSIGG